MALKWYPETWYCLEKLYIAIYGKYSYITSLKVAVGTLVMDDGKVDSEAHG